MPRPDCWSEDWFGVAIVTSVAVQAAGEIGVSSGLVLSCVLRMLLRLRKTASFAEYTARLSRCTKNGTLRFGVSEQPPGAVLPRCPLRERMGGERREERV